MQSPYTLTPLKVVYKKLRILVDRGCIFIGHGLSKDFRIISKCVFSIDVDDVNVSVQIFSSHQSKSSIPLIFTSSRIVNDDCLFASYPGSS